MNKERFRIIINREINQILDKYCKLEHRDRSNMIETMILAYDKIHKNKE